MKVNFQSPLARFERRKRRSSFVHLPHMSEYLL